MSFKFIVSRQIAPEYDISTHQIQIFSSAEGAQPSPQTPPPVGRGTPPPHTPSPRPLRRLVLRPPPRLKFLDPPVIKTRFDAYSFLLLHPCIILVYYIICLERLVSGSLIVAIISFPESQGRRVRIIFL